MRRTHRMLTLAGLFAAFTSTSALAGAPHFKPSAYSKLPEDITKNAYGANKDAPRAPGIGDFAPDFELPVVAGGRWRLSEALQKGPVVIVFYRGFW